jgi:acetyl esterase/lipase
MAPASESDGRAQNPGSETRAVGRVKIEEGVVFGTGGRRPLLCDVYRPPEPRPDRKSVLLVHGGGWARGDRKQLGGYGIALGRLGYTSVCAEYRLSGEAKWPAQIHDVKACLRFMRAEASGLGIDPERIAVSGNSAGGHLALILAATPGMPEFEGDGGNPGVPTHVNACVSFYAPTQLARSRHLDTAIRELFDADASETVAHGASPLAYADQPDFPPTLLLHGNEDELVPVEASLQMYRQLRAAGVRAELHAFSEAKHAFDAAGGLGRQCGQLIHLFLERHT